MTEFETRLRDALGARAAAVGVDPRAYEHLVRRRERRRLTRWATPIGAVAATVALVGGVAVVGGIARHANPVEPTAGGPKRVIAIRDFRAVVLDPANLDGPPLYETQRTDGNVSAVAAVGDGRRFYIAANFTAKCKTALFRLDADSKSLTQVGGLWSVGRVASLAVSRDERTLAYSTYRRTDEGCTDKVQVRVRDLLTATEKAWTAPGAKPYTQLDNLVWSPDGRYVAYEYDYNVGRLDTRHPGALPVPDPLGIRLRDGGQCYAHVPAYLPTGALVVAARCEGFNGPWSMHLALYDPVRNRLGRELVRVTPFLDVQEMTLDASGRHALLMGALIVGPHTSGSPVTVFRWDKGTPTRQVTDNPEPRLRGFDW